MSSLQRIFVGFTTAWLVGPFAFSSLEPPAFAQAAGGSQGGYDLNDSSLDERYDWVITVQVKVIKDYLKYPSSTLNPMTKLSIVSRQTPRLQKDRVPKIVQYEDLWYHECNAIGCRRYNELAITPGQQGTIRVIPSQDASDSSCAVANALTRLMLDVGLMRSALSVVYLPADLIDGVTSDLSKFNFFEYTARPDHPIRTSLIISIFSDPPGQKRSLYYDPAKQ